MDSKQIMDRPYRELELATEDGYPLQLRIYEGRKRAVIQCIHGMEEHQGRYEAFASFLAEAGFVVVTSDLRGHGPKAVKVKNKKNGKEMIHIADKDGDQLLVKDQALIRKKIKELYPDCPVILFGHSMGSIIARKALQADVAEYDKAILCGYPVPQGLSVVGIFLSNLIGAFKGRRGQSNLLTMLAVGPFCKAIKGAETPVDWLSVDKENVKRYIADPECGLEFTIGSYNALFKLVWDISKPPKLEGRENFPILLICGEEDPCTGGENGRAQSLSCLKKTGFAKITSKIWPSMRHEILQEKEKVQVFRMIQTYLEEEL